MPEAINFFSSSQRVKGSLLGGCWVVSGPAVVQASSDFEVLGYRPDRDVRLVVPVGRSVILVGETRPNVTSGQVIECDRKSIDAIYQLKQSLDGSRRIVLVGPTDSGKSTLASFIYNAGLVNFVASVDVGQNEVYCPGFAAVSSPQRPFVPGSVAGEPRACLVGDFTPRGLEAAYLYCAARLLKGVSDFVVDTDGWVEGGGLVLKAALAEVLDAAVVAVGLDDEARRALSSYLGDVIFVGRIAPRPKSPSERKTNRDRLLASCLLGARRRVLSYDLLVGRPFTEDVKGLIASAYGEGWDHFAVLEKISERSGTVTILTKFMGEVNAIRLGRARVELQPTEGT
ncbi:MAG: Clp1/GlmU family protein [Acidilobus sp.]